MDTVSYQDGTSVHFTYDQHDRLSSMTDSLGTTTYVRDNAGRVTSVTDANGNTVGYTYDENGYTGLLTTLTYPGGNQVYYTYDELNRLKTVTNWLNQTATYNYDDAGRLVSLTNFNGTVTTYSFDDADRLTGLDTKTSGNSVIAAYSYTLDGNGNRVSIDKNIPSTGTLPQRNETADYLHNRLTSTDSALYGYDNEGQLASKEAGGTVSYSFDKAYRLTGIGNTESFSYDGAGNRLRAVRSGVETRYINDAGGNLLAEADSSNTITRYYVHGAGLLAAISPADDLYCYHYDGVGNTVAITDSSEAVVNSYDYSPFGMIISENETFPQPFKYVGKLGVMAESNGFYYMRARYYDPVVGRFISEDPLGFDGGDVNLYVYGSNNPLLVVDPWGLEAGLAGRIWHDAVSATRQGFHAAVWLATEGPAPARYTLQSAVALAAAPFAAVATMETGSALATVGRAAMNVARANPGAIQAAQDFIGAALPTTSPAVSEAGFIGAVTGAAIQEYQAYQNSVK